MPIRRNLVPSAPAPAVRGRRRRSWPRAASAGRTTGPCAQAKIGGLELQGHGRARKRGALEPGGDLFAQAPQAQLELTELGDVLIEGGLGRDALGLALGPDRTVVDAAGQPRKARAFGAVAAHQFGCAGTLQVDMVRKPLRLMGLRGLADAENLGDRLGGQKAAASPCPSTAKPRGLSRSEAILARNRCRRARSTP